MFSSILNLTTIFYHINIQKPKQYHSHSSSRRFHSVSPQYLVFVYPPSVPWYPLSGEYPLLAAGLVLSGESLYDVLVLRGLTLTSKRGEDEDVDMSLWAGPE